MKIIFLFLALFFLSVFSPFVGASDFEYPPLINEAKQLSYFVPKGWNVHSLATGDLNDDHLTDIAAVIQYTGKSMPQGDGVDLIAEEGSPRIFFILFKQDTGEYVLSIQDNNVIKKYTADISDRVAVEQGSVIVESANEGGQWRWNKKARFFVHNNGWYLKGLNYLEFHTYGEEFCENDYDLGAVRIIKNLRTKLHQHVPPLHYWLQAKYQQTLYPVTHLVSLF